MPVHAQSGEVTEAEERQLQADPHWQLIERVLASEGFERATQLRHLLRYISRTALLHPEVVLREYEIACDVLGRRSDFDPSRDNIARAQVSHLRRKLDHYFNTEGKDEPLVLTIQKGSYTPVFRPSAVQTRSDETENSFPPEPAPVAPAIPAAPGAIASPPQPAPFRTVRAIALASVLLAVISGAFLIGRHSAPAPSKPASGNAFVRFLGRSQGNVTIVAPDLSLVMVRSMSGADVSVSDYTRSDYPKRRLESIKDQATRDKLLEFAIFPNTTFNEAMIGFDFKEAMQKLGVHAEIRYARTLHVQDLSQGNSLLVGGEGSNPWTGLFSDKMNFRYVEVNDHLHYFENAHPQPGELPRYNVIYPNEANVAVGYADIALTQNPTRTGYILLINGTDLQASEAATRYLLHGTLPPEITSMLNREDLRYFEILLRGRHIGQEAEDNVDLVALRQ